MCTTSWDIANFVMQLTWAMSNPRDEYVVAVKRLLQYLKGTPDLCEVLERFYPSRMF